MITIDTGNIQLEASLSVSTNTVECKVKKQDKAINFCLNEEEAKAFHALLGRFLDEKRFRDTSDQHV